jgi:hypothetical protein
MKTKIKINTWLFLLFFIFYFWLTCWSVSAMPINKSNAFGTLILLPEAIAIFVALIITIILTIIKSFQKKIYAVLDLKFFGIILLSQIYSYFFVSILTYYERPNILLLFIELTCLMTVLLYSIGIIAIAIKTISSSTNNNQQIIKK